MTNAIHRLVAAGLTAAVCASLPACGSAGGATDPAPVQSASEFSLEQHRGKVLLLNFWATWCGPCRYEIPALVELRNQYDADQVSIVGIAIGENGTEEAVRKRLEDFAGRYGINYTLYYDQDYKVAKLMHELSPFLPYVPSTLIFDAKGRVVETHRGLPRGDKGQPDPLSVLSRDIDRILDQG